MPRPESYRHRPLAEHQKALSLELVYARRLTSRRSMIELRMDCPTFVASVFLSKLTVAGFVPLCVISEV